MRLRKPTEGLSPGLPAEERKPDLPLFVATLILVGFGTIMVYSSSAIYAWASSEFGNEYFFFKRHIFRLGAGLCAMWVAERLDYRFWSKVAKPLMGVCLALLLAVLIFGSGGEQGATRWLRLSFISVQPSELAKVCLVIYLASYLATKGDRIKEFRKGLIPPLAVLGLLTLLLLRQPNFGTAAAILVIAFLVLYVGGARMHHLVLTGLAGALVVGLLAYNIPYARNRITGFLGTTAGSLDGNYQVRQSVLGMGSGGLIGEGLGQSKVKLLSLPEPHTDFVFAVVAEELGFLGSAILLGMFLFVAIRGMQIGVSCQDAFGTLLASGLSIAIFTYVLLHVAVVVGSVPTTGLPLPFLSFGGSALFTNLVAIGIVLNVSRSSPRLGHAVNPRRFAR